MEARALLQPIATIQGAMPVVQAAFNLYDSFDGGWSCMGAISLRLPDELEGKLAQEASLSGQPRSQLIREALEALLTLRQRQRDEAALAAAAMALAADADACREAQLVAEEFVAAENEALEGHWWR
jgi:predicted transcriptional regulator